MEIYVPDVFDTDVTLPSDILPHTPDDKYLLAWEAVK